MARSRPHRPALLTFAAGLALVALGGCASAPSPELEQRATEVTTYKMAQLAGKSYELVGNIWADSWRSSFASPTFPAEDQAMAALRLEAARRGANGLVNVVCLDQGRTGFPTRTEPAVLCYANAIRLGERAG